MINAVSIFVYIENKKNYILYKQTLISLKINYFRITSPFFFRVAYSISQHN